jgi:hypothetical protein
MFAIDSAVSFWIAFYHTGLSLLNVVYEMVGRYNLVRSTYDLPEQDSVFRFSHQFA